MAPQRFLNGITNNSSADPLGALTILDPTKWSVYFEDFVGPLLNTATVNNTTVAHGGLSIIGSTNGTVSVVTDADSPDGNLKIITTAADNESGEITTVAPGFTMTEGKKFVLEARFEITHTNGVISENEIFVGLASAQTGDNFFASDGTARTFDDGIGFYSPDAATSIDLICGENDVFDSITAIGTYATGAWYTCTVYYDGSMIQLWVNGAKVAEWTPSVIPVSPIGPAIYLQTGEAKVHQLLCDYILVAKERS